MLPRPECVSEFSGQSDETCRVSLSIDIGRCVDHAHTWPGEDAPRRDHTQEGSYRGTWPRQWPPFRSNIFPVHRRSTDLCQRYPYISPPDMRCSSRRRGRCIPCCKCSWSHLCCLHRSLSAILGQRLPRHTTIRGLIFLGLTRQPQTCEIGTGGARLLSHLRQQLRKFAGCTCLTRSRSVDRLVSVCTRSVCKSLCGGL